MAVTATPIFPQTPNSGIMNCLLTTAMTNTKAFDGTDTAGTALAQSFLAGVNGARVDMCKIRFTSLNGATASGTTNATVIRLFQNNGAVNTTATNNKFIGEIAVPAQVVAALATGIMNELVYNLDLDIPAGHKIYAGSTVAVGGTSCAFLVDVTGGDY